MQLEKQLANLELSKKLKELGVKQESLFYWQPLWQPGEKAQLMHLIWPASKIENRPDIEQTMLPYSAFTVAELGEMLPLGCSSTKINEYKKDGTTKIWQSNTARYIGGRDGRMIIEYGNTEADARAKMLIYLLDHKLITL